MICVFLVLVVSVVSCGAACAQTPTPTSVPAPFEAVDLTGDGIVDADDIFAFLLQWRRVEGPTPTETPTEEATATPTETPTSIEMVFVPGGTFTMGARDDGDDLTYRFSDELPRHEVMLSAYQIGKFEVTNAQYAEVLNWAIGQGYLRNSSNGAYSGGFVYFNGQALLYLSVSSCQISYSNGSFLSETREGYSMADHPVVEVTWYGCVAFCNWLSEMEGRSPCYTLTNNNWNLTNRFGGGYRLPTEAEWERAAAWDGSKHWIYGFRSDTLTGRDRCNYFDGLSPTSYVNPLGFSDGSYTSPVGWFNGTNRSPNGNIQTVDSPSPIGCYDMSGNVLEWCEDAYQNDFYGTADATAENPLCTNPVSAYKVIRGGFWYDYARYCRSAYRFSDFPTFWVYDVGFRVVRTP